MHEDQRRAVIQVMSRISRDTQIALDQRYRHFRITDAIILITSLLLVVLAVFNVYYVRVLYEDLNGIVANMDSMYNHLRGIDEDMVAITKRMDAFDRHIEHMDPIRSNMVELAETMPSVRSNMDMITRHMTGIEQSMDLVGNGMGMIDDRVGLMTEGVRVMRENVRQIARPLRGIGSVLP